MNWGNVSGPSTWIDLGAPRSWFRIRDINAAADIRQFRVHEVTSPALLLRNPFNAISGNLTANNDLFFYGTQAEAQMLVGRRVYFQALDNGLRTRAPVPSM
jgi:hypothetical protein